MARRVFYSFHYEPDNWRASQVRNMGVVDGNRPASDNDWETVKRGGEPAIQRWIDGQLEGTSCTVVLIGSGTAGRKWINYEIERSWNRGNGLVGVYIHKLLDRYGRQSLPGNNPFSGFTLNQNQTPLTQVVQTFDSPTWDSRGTYGYICSNLSAWIEQAVAVRGRY